MATMLPRGACVGDMLSVSGEPLRLKFGGLSFCPHHGCLDLCLGKLIASLCLLQWKWMHCRRSRSGSGSLLSTQPKHGPKSLEFQLGSALFAFGAGVGLLQKSPRQQILMVQSPLYDWSPVDGGLGRACRGASAQDNQASYYTVVSGGGVWTRQKAEKSHKGH